MKPVTRAVAMRFLGERGATGVEYGLMVALIAMAIFGTVYLLGPPPAPEPPAPPSVYYEDCDEVRAAGADPIRVGDPGYRPELDPDGDGVGCE